MATIVLLHHGMHRHVPTHYVASLLLEPWRNSGHTAIEHFGADDPPPGDILFVHVDLTVVPAEYRALFPRYRRVINGAVLDISKRTFSQNIVERGSDWNGPVLVKTDANFFGRSEWIVYAIAEQVGVARETPAGPWMKDYLIYGSLGEVPDWVWTSPGLIVEKFLPERDARGYYLRQWTFLGNRERGQRVRSETPIIKRDNVVEREPVSVPDEIRAWREKLGFDFGKFDYLMHEGRPILIDANKTPGARVDAQSNPKGRGTLLALAEGLQAFLP